MIDCGISNKMIKKWKDTQISRSDISIFSFQEFLQTKLFFTFSPFIQMRKKMEYQKK